MNLLTAKKRAFPVNWHFFQLRNSLSFMEPASWLLCSHETAPWPSSCGSTMQSESDTLSLYDPLFSSTSLFQKCLHHFHLKPVRILICHSWIKFVLFDFIKVITSFWSNPRRCKACVIKPRITLTSSSNEMLFPRKVSSTNLMLMWLANSFHASRHVLILDLKRVKIRT